MDRHEYGPSHRIRNFLLFMVLIVAALVVVAFTRGTAPKIDATALPRAVGMHTPIVVNISDNMGVTRATVYYEQNGRRLPITEQTTQQRRNWLFTPKQGRQIVLNLNIGRKDVAGLEDGTADLVIDAQAANVRGSKSVMRRTVEVRSVPPRVAAVTTQHYVNQGGADMIVYTVSPGTTESGVEVAGDFFPGYQMPNAAAGMMFSIFAFPYDAPADAKFELVARDDAGNETRQAFPIHTFPKKFPARPMQITDDFIRRVVMAIIANTPSISDQHDPLKNFLLVNHDLRRENTKELAEMSKQTAREFLWHDAFTRLPAKTEASFADHRYYIYNGQKVDDEFHLGIDLAGTQHMPIKAANSGRVVMARYFGIYGNAILIDHGYGLMSLYGHMNDFAVKPGDTVQQGQLIGHSDTTGMAAGDHLHFSVLLDGEQIDPKEWWDQHWIHDRIQAKLAQ